MGSRLHHMLLDVLFDQLGHQAVDGTAHRRNEIENVPAGLLIVQGALDRLHLTRQTPHASEQLRLVSRQMSHGKGGYPIPKAPVKAGRPMARP